MAFRQPTYHPQPRIFTTTEATVPAATLSPQLSEQLDESQEWILFPHSTLSTTDRTFTASTQGTRRTVGRSRISDNGSLDTAARSYGFDDDVSEHTEAIIEDEEDGELDSLDSHLHEFRAEPNAIREPSLGNLNATGIPVLPTHDGLGSFRIDRAIIGEGVQEHIYAFEQYNPRRIKRRRESLELGQIALESEKTLEYERIRRIEEWRLEQSRALLDEIEKEATRLNYTVTSGQRSIIHDGQEEEAATLGSVAEEGPQASGQHDQLPDDVNEGFWSRITRRVIRDLMGIDDQLLSILFGEALPDDDDLSSTPPAGHPPPSILASVDMDIDTWEYRLLHRVATELGLLVNQLSDHPGAFSTYCQVEQMQFPYAGLPIIPEIVQDTAQDAIPLQLVAFTPEFRPTIQTKTQPLDISRGVSLSTHRQLGMIEDVDATPRPEFLVHNTIGTQDTRVEFTKEEWEKQLDIKMVFRYLRSRFTTRPTVRTSFPRDTYTATSTPQDAAARAARVRQHHPLVTRQKSVERRNFKTAAPSIPILHRRGSSCASQSTKKSAKRNSGSSRHYWDINGSIGSGSLIATGGAWGEV